MGIFHSFQLRIKTQDLIKFGTSSPFCITHFLDPFSQWMVGTRHLGVGTGPTSFHRLSPRFGASYCGFLGFWARLGDPALFRGFPGMTYGAPVICYMGIISYTIILYKDNQDFPWKVKRLRKFQQWVRKESQERKGCVCVCGSRSFECFFDGFLPYKSRGVSWFWRGWLLLSSNSHW